MEINSKLDNKFGKIDSLEKFKLMLKSDIDFILEGKEITQNNVARAAYFVYPKIARFSHKTFNDRQYMMAGYIGHKMRENFRKELTDFVKDYLKEKLKSIETHKKL
jgi:hypothetical protein